MIQRQLSIFWLVSGVLNQPLVEIQGMQTLEIEGQTHQTPFSGNSQKAAQRELAETQDFLDNPDHGFNGAFAQAIDLLANLSLELVGHLYFGTGFVVWLLGQSSEKGVPIYMVRLTPGSNIGFDFSLLEGMNIGFTEVTVVQGSRFGFAQFGSNSIQGGHGLLLVIGMVGKSMRYDEQALLVSSHLHVVVLVKALIGAILHDA